MLTVVFIVFGILITILSLKVWMLNLDVKINKIDISYLQRSLEKAHPNLQGEVAREKSPLF